MVPLNKEADTAVPPGVSLKFYRVGATKNENTGPVETEEKRKRRTEGTRIERSTVK